MYIEKERKFLVYGDALVMDTLVQDIATMKLVHQGYFRVADANQVRVSITDNIKGRINIKGARNHYSRPEFEYTIPVEDAREMINLCGSQVITKIRLHLKSTKRLVVDIYGEKNQGLIIAEAEFDPNSRTRYIPKRKWLKTDVTDVNRYYNKELVRSPFCMWIDSLKKIILPEDIQADERERRRIASDYVWTNTTISMKIFEKYEKEKNKVPEWEVL